LKTREKRIAVVAPERPVPLNVVIRRNMQAMPTRNSSPEVQLRRALHALGLRFRLHCADLPGRPDIVFSAARVAVFADGCFWHACPTHAVFPKNNRTWWRQKLLGNRKRDRLKDRQLHAMGWLTIHVWEHEDMQRIAKAVARTVRNRMKAFARGR